MKRRRCFEVGGESMRPTLRPGQRVLVDPRAYARRVPALGDIVVARHPFRREVHLVKRVARVDGDRVFLAGDNPAESTDSRTLGGFLPERIVGRVTSALPEGDA